MDWGAPGDKLEAACSRVLERVSKFQRRWLVDHCCRQCIGKEITIDGNAKVRTKLCANTDAGVWNCNPLNSHCLTGCTHPPLRRSRFCAFHRRDAEPFFGSDLLVAPSFRSCLRQKTCKNDTRMLPARVALPSGAFVTARSALCALPCAAPRETTHCACCTSRKSRERASTPSALAQTKL